MTEQIICNSDEVRHIGTQIGAATETYAGTATDRIMDAAHNQGEGKWGNAELGAPAAFGEVYSRRLLRLEQEMQQLAAQVEEFSHKVQDVAARANTTDEDIARMLAIEERALSSHDYSPGISQSSTENSPSLSTWRD